MYSRQLGWKAGRRSGLRSQPKFYLGTDLKEAKRRNSKLEALWECVESLAAEGAWLKEP